MPCLSPICLLNAVNVKAAQFWRVSCQGIEQSFRNVRGILCQLRLPYFQQELMFQRHTTPRRAETLVHHLAFTARSEGRRQERFPHRNPRPNDLEPRPDQ